MRRKIGFRSLKMAEDRVKTRSRSVRMRQDVVFVTPRTFYLDFRTVSWAILGPSCAHLGPSWALRRPQESLNRAFRCTVYGPEAILFRLRAGCYLVPFTGRMLSGGSARAELHRHLRDCPKTKGRPVQRPVGVFNPAAHRQMGRGPC